MVPDKCMLTIDQLTVPGQDHRAILLQVEDLIANMAQRIPDFHALVKAINDCSPLATSPTEPIILRFCDVVEHVTGERPKPKGVSYYTDAAVFVPALKAPLIICCPGDPKLAHQTNEYVELGKMIEAARLLMNGKVYRGVSL